MTVVAVESRVAVAAGFAAILLLTPDLARLLDCCRFGVFVVFVVIVDVITGADDVANTRCIVATDEAATTEDAAAAVDPAAAITRCC